jgi:hypothetical protein
MAVEGVLSWKDPRFFEGMEEAQAFDELDKPWRDLPIPTIARGDTECGRRSWVLLVPS